MYRRVTRKFSRRCYALTNIERIEPIDREVPHTPQLLTPHQRKEWERWAAELARQGEQRAEVAVSSAAVATRLLDALSDMAERSACEDVLSDDESDCRNASSG